MRRKHRAISVARSSVISESLVFVSYHNSDIAYAFKLARLLKRTYRPVWLDRYDIQPGGDWQADIRSAWADASVALAIVSDDYLRSPYCRAEFEALLERGLPVTAVIARDFSTDAMAEFDFSDWVDFRRWFDDPQDISVENLLSRFPPSDAAKQAGERADYLLQFIQDTEIALSSMPSSWAAKHSAATTRPRALPFVLLHDWHFTVGETKPITDLEGWVQDNARFTLLGEAGSGKTTVARTLALAQAHRALRDEEQALPIWLDLARWDATRESSEQFIESNWPLVSYWRHWLAGNPGLLLLDNWGDLERAHPGGARELADWLDGLPNQRVIALADELGDALPDMPLLEIDRLGAESALGVAGTVLTLERHNSFRQILTQKRALILESPLAYLALGLELLAADRALANNDWQADPAGATLRLRAQQVRPARYGLTVEAAMAGLEELASAMLGQERHRFIPRDEARACIRDIRIIEYALELGILTDSGELLRFESDLLRAAFACAGLKPADYTEWLDAPVIGADGLRIANKWDWPAMLLVDSLDDVSRPRAIEQIAETDPFLAGMCLCRHAHLPDKCLAAVLRRLLDFCARQPTARPELLRTLARIAKPQRVADSLIDLLRDRDNARQLQIWQEIAALPLEPPSDFVDALTAPDDGSEVSSADFIATYGLSRSLAYLVALTRHDDASLRQKAYRRLGQLKAPATLILLLDDLESAIDGDLETILIALLSFNHAEALRRSLRWSQDNLTGRAPLAAALAACGRRVSGRLLALADEGRLTLRQTYYELVVDCPEREIALGLASVAAQYIELPEAIKAATGSTPAGMRERVSSVIKHKPNRAGFAQLLDDIAKVLEDPPEAIVRAGSQLENLLYGAPIFDRTEPESDGASEQVEWQARLQDIRELSGAPASESLPILLEATTDVDKRVRLAAYEQLAQLEGETAAQKALIAGLADSEAEVVAAVTDLLRGIELDEYDAVYELLASPKSATGAAAIAILGASNEREAITALRQLQDDSRQPEPQGATLSQLAQEAIAKLEAATAAEDEASENGRAGAKSPASQFSAGEKVQRALQVLRDDDWGRTQKAAKFLRKFARHMRGTDTGEMRELLCAALADPAWTARWAAAEALAMLHDRQAIAALTRALRDDNWIVQVAALRALVELAAEQAAPDILPLLKSRRKQVREAAAEALGQLEASMALPALGAVLMNDEDDFARLAAISAICQIGGETRPWLEIALSDRYLDLRLYAMRQLCPDMDEGDLPILNQLLEDDAAPSYEAVSLRDLALATLERIDSPASRALLAGQAMEERAGA